MSNNTTLRPPLPQLSFLPAPVLRPYIRAYRFFDLDARHPYVVPAWTRAMMLIRYGDFFEARYPDGAAVPHLRASFFGPTTRPLRYGSDSGRYRFVSVEFYPGVMPQMLRERMTAFLGRVVPADTFLAQARLDELSGELCEARDTAQRRVALDRFLAEQLPLQEVETQRWLQRGLQLVHGSSGRLNAVDLARALDSSPRTLRRRFNDVLGLPPQLYRRIMRTERALGLVYARPHLSGSQIALALGFSDQSHLLHDLGQFAGITPGRAREDLSTGIGPLHDFFVDGFVDGFSHGTDRTHIA